MTALIDIVFQLVIFFIVTVKMDDPLFASQIKLADAPNGKQGPKPRVCIKVTVAQDGALAIKRHAISYDMLETIASKTVRQCGTATPVYIAADGRALHRDVSAVMKICSGKGLTNQVIVAVNDKDERHGRWPF